MSGLTRTIIIVLILLNHTAGYCQRYDFNWVFGYAGGQGDTRWGTSFVDFNSGNPIVSYQDKGRLYIYEANASISDKEGNLLYYTNGYDVEDANFKKVLGATNLGIRYWDGLVEPQGVMFLNNPSSDSNNYLFYINIVLNSPHFHVLDLNYLLIEKFTSKVINRGNVVHDTLNSGCLTSCKHANGRDNWILLNKENTNIFYKILVSPSGISTLSYQNVGPRITEGAGQAVFSPNGEYFALLDAITFSEGLYIKLYKFDRCTGELEFIRMENYPTSSFSGISFSPNSRYLYYSEQKNLYQIDLQNPESFINLNLIDTIESQTAWGSQYNLHQLGPDGRIYISNAYSNFVMHRINKPNELGKACLPRSNSFVLKTLGGYGIPNMPNFRLGPVDGSSCDTLGIDNIPWAWWRYDQDTSRYRCFEFVDLSGYLTEESEPEWYWDLGDGTQSRDTSPIHCFEKDGVYEVCLIVKNKYGSDTLCRTLNVGTSATNDEGKIEIKSDIFPNPASDHFVLNVYDYLPESMYLYLINAQGQTIRRERVFQGSNVIDIEQLPAGVYSVVIYERGAVVKTEKIVVRD